MRVVERSTHRQEAIGFKSVGWCELIRSEIMNLAHSSVFLDLSRRGMSERRLRVLCYHGKGPTHLKLRLTFQKWVASQHSFSHWKGLRNNWRSCCSQERSFPYRSSLCSTMTTQKSQSKVSFPQSFKR